MILFHNRDTASHIRDTAEWMLASVLRVQVSESDVPVDMRLRARRMRYFAHRKPKVTEARVGILHEGIGSPDNTQIWNSS